ncbi:acyl-CoA N-acyltransferase [Hypoxylon crocopeplum]|nr:acyl-CoA N-acyltransferase [Hypoxylon crocopeplum]
MVPQKRKRSHEAITQLAEPPQPPPRATRRRPAPPEEPEHQLRSGRVRANAAGDPTHTVPNTGAPQHKKNDASKTDYTREITRLFSNTKTSLLDSKRVLEEIIQLQNHNENENKDEGGEREQVRQRRSRQTISTTARQGAGSPPPQQKRRMPPKSSQQQQQQQKQQQPLRPTHTAASTAVQTSTPKRRASSDKLPKPPPTPRSDRNVDKVVLGSIWFRAWYPSYYGKEVLGDASGNNNAGAKDETAGGKMGKIGGGKRAGLPPPLLEQLYVCPWCFKYSREMAPWWKHVGCCERTFEMPGTKVYTHPKGSRVKSVKIPAATASVPDVGGKGKGKKKGDTVAGAGVPPTAAVEVVTDEGEWSVWEVDGEKDRLFCQHLSLFAKLFLDNKSVFFDVTGFNYFLLVYTPPPFPSPPPSSLRNNNATQQPPIPPPLADVTNQQPRPSSSAAHATSSSQPASIFRPQVVGFFSKEKLSWDSNNLACILVFPPWQRKGLGALLMGVSYEISRREGILGGPEKPISELGRKGYKRFWAGKIARWLLQLEIAPNADGGGKDTLVSVEDCSASTWIAPEDCLAVLREMGVVEDAGLGPAKAHGSDDGDADMDPEDEDSEAKVVEMVPRVRIDKQAVLRWVRAHKIDLELPCDPDGFVEGYAVKGGEGGDEMGDEG